MASTASQSAPSRARTQARKKVNDDAAYFGPSSSGTAGTKRQAADRADGEPRVKRKRVDVHVAPANNNLKKETAEGEPRKCLLEFQKLPTSVLQKYLVSFEIVPLVHPSPLTAEDPPPPSSLADPVYQARPPSPAASTPVIRQQRESRDPSGRRRSSRHVEEEVRTRVPILADSVELHNVLASVVERHFREHTVSGKEVDTLAAFMCALEKSKGAKNKI